jgi:hypothetical protein
VPPVPMAVARPGGQRGVLSPTTSGGVTNRGADPLAYPHSRFAPDECLDSQRDVNRG